MTTYIAFSWGFGSCAVASLLLFLAWTRRRKPAATTTVLTMPAGSLTVPRELTDEEFNKLAAAWTAAFENQAPHTWVQP